ncbi:DUF4097 family beta strand repeat protein [candidate division KSB1 bacterium]|nr:DUF4097 family beta strand repeat protein [candidate division KSB1 bacterium]
MQRKFLLSSFILIFVFFSFATADVKDSIKETFRVEPNGTLWIDSDLGSIEVKAASGSRVDIEVERTVRVGSRRAAEEILEDLEITFDQHGNDVKVTARYDKPRSGLWDAGRSKLNLKFFVMVPEKYNVNLKTSGGSIKVDDLQGEVEAKTSGGSLKFGHIGGPVNGRTSGGSITIDGCDGQVDVQTSGGSIQIGNVEGTVDAHTSGGSITIERADGSVTAETSGGSINVNEVFGDVNASTSGGSVNARMTKQPNGECRLTTSGGSVNVHLPDDAHVDIDAKTSGGRVKTDFRVTMSVQGEIKQSKLEGEINGGGPLLYLRTSGGNININRQ